MKAQEEYAGRLLHVRVNEPSEPSSGAIVRWKSAVWPFEMVWLDEVTQGATLLPKQRAKSKPIPESASGVPAGSTLSLTVSVPLCVPALAGANSRATVQLAPTPSVVPQVPGIFRKPVEATIVRFCRLFTLSGLVIVTVLALLVKPTPVCAKVNGLGWN